MYKWGPSTQHHVDVNVRDINLIDLEPSLACAFLASQQKRLGNFLGEKEGEREKLNSNTSRKQLHCRFKFSNYGFSF